jgi:FkbM family methyltransferase
MSNSTIWKRVAAFILRAITVVGAVFICFEAGVWFHPPLLAWGLGVVDSHLICSSMEALRGAQKHQQVFNSGKDLLSKAHIIQSDDKLNLWRTARGDWWVPKNSEESVLGFLIQQQNRIYGEGSWGVRKGDVVLDCGANIGVYTREALDEGAALVVAIEPAPINVECLRRNFKREIEEKRVVVEAIGVWNQDDVLPLYEDPQNSGADSFVIRSPRDRIAKNIPLTSIDKLSKQLELPHVSFIKMDIKGATAKALEGAKGILISERPRLALSTEELEDNPAQIRSLVLSLQPSYRMACGICSIDGLKVNPDVLLFQP